MTPDAYVALLNQMVERKIITFDESADLYNRFVDGEFDEDDLPMLPELDEDDDEAALLLLLAVFGFGARRIVLKERQRRRDLLRRQFEMSIARLATDNLPIRTWQERMGRNVHRSIVQSWATGVGQERQPNGNLDQVVAEQLSYVYRFAGDRHALDALGRPMNNELIASRSMQYYGAAWSAWFVGNESLNTDVGWVSYYLPRDDRGTCQPCSAARGYYLPGQGPFPGQICRGGGYCRCQRILIYDPTRYQSL